MKKYILIFSVFLGALTANAQQEKPSMVEFLSNVVLFNPTYIHMHETDNKLTHDIMVSGRLNYEIQFMNRQREDVFKVFDDEQNLLFEVKEDVAKPATLINLGALSPGKYSIQRNVGNKVYSFEVEKRK